MSSADFVRSPLTLAILGTLVAYYVTYGIGLLRAQHRQAGVVTSDPQA